MSEGQILDVFGKRDIFIRDPFSEMLKCNPMNSNDRLLAVLSHILAIVPGIGILGPLVIYLVLQKQQ